MNRSHRTRARLGGLLLVALGALAVLALPGMAAAKAGDRNHDRIPDRWEKRHHLSLKVKQTHRDQDRDRLRNRAEFLAGDNPTDPDTDNDGVTDGNENAGTIKSFDAGTGRLVIDLFGGDTISGLVTEGTEIECEGEGVDVPDGGNNQQGVDEPDGDNNQGDEPGDDNAGDDNSDSDDEGDDDANCTTADLVPGAIVEEAELELANGKAIFESVELAD